MLLPVAPPTPGHLSRPRPPLLPLSARSRRRSRRGRPPPRVPYQHRRRLRRNNGARRLRRNNGAYGRRGRPCLLSTRESARASAAHRSQPAVIRSGSRQHNHAAPRLATCPAHAIPIRQHDSYLTAWPARLSPYVLAHPEPCPTAPPFSSPRPWPRPGSYGPRRCRCALRESAVGDQWGVQSV